MGLALALALERFPCGGVNASQFEMPGEVDGVEGAEGLPLEGGDVAVEVDAEVVPGVLLPSRKRGLYEKGLRFCFGAAGREDHSAFGLHAEGRTLVRSERTSSRPHGRPG